MKLIIEFTGLNSVNKDEVTKELVDCVKGIHIVMRNSDSFSINASVSVKVEDFGETKEVSI